MEAGRDDDSSPTTRGRLVIALLEIRKVISTHGQLTSTLFQNIGIMRASHTPDEAHAPTNLQCASN